MFGFSLQKLIFTGIAIAAVWYGFRWFKQLQERESGRVRQRSSGPKSKATGGSQSSATTDDSVETMTECGVCGTYVSSSDARSCGRESCPYPG